MTNETFFNAKNYFDRKQWIEYKIKSNSFVYTK